MPALRDPDQRGVVAQRGDLVVPGLPALSRRSRASGRSRAPTSSGSGGVAWSLLAPRRQHDCTRPCAYGMRSTWPTWRVVDVNPLSCMIAATVVPNDPAMP